MNPAPLLEYIKRTPYPSYAGAKVGGASLEAADVMEKTGAKTLWIERCKDLFEIRGDWTAEEGIQHYAAKLGLEARYVDKNLRPRFTDLTNTKPAFLYKSGERRGNNKIKAHVYKLAAYLVMA